VEDYLRQGIVALLPVYTAQSRSLVVTQSAEHLEGRSVSWLLDQFAKQCFIDLRALRSCCGALLDLHRLIALPISDNLILLPLKTRQAQAPGETTIGLVNMIQVAGYETHSGPGPWLSIVNCKTGYRLYTLNTTATVKTRMLQGGQARDHCLKMRSLGREFVGMSRDALIAQLPPCECLMKDFFCSFFKLDPGGSG